MVIGRVVPLPTLARVVRAQGLAVLLLASASPARRRLLEQAAIAHRVQVSGVDEEAIHHPDPAQLVQLLAQAKAGAVLQGGIATEISAVLGCDSLLAFEGEVFGKPTGPQEAIARWQRMRGAWGDLHTGHALLNPAGGEYDNGDHPGPVCGAERRRNSGLWATGEPLQCAGGFAPEGRGVPGGAPGWLFLERHCLSLPLLRQWLRAAEALPKPTVAIFLSP